MKCAVCGNERTIVFTRKGKGSKTEYADFKAGNCSYCSWKGDEGPGKELRDKLPKKEERQVPTREDFIQYVVQNYEAYTSDVEQAIHEEITFNIVHKSEESSVALSNCVYWLSMPRKPITPDTLFTFRRAALYFQALRKKE